MDTDGNILRLTDMNPPAPSAAEAESNLEVAEQPPLTQEVAITQMTDLLGAEFVAKLKDLISTSANEESTTGVEASNISSSTTTDSTTTTSTSTTTNTTTSSTNPTAATTESSPTEPPASAPRFIVSDSIYSKEIRSTVHKLVKSCFAQDCWAKTLEGDKIQIFKGKECKKKKGEGEIIFGIRRDHFLTT